MKISLIVAMAGNRAIGLNGQMPWHLSADLKHFRKITMGSPVIMGRKTFDAIGRPLPGRDNLVVSRNAGYRCPGCKVFADIGDAVEACRGRDEIFIIGGATLYQAMLPAADYLYLTLIHKDFAGDTFFPEFDAGIWREIERTDIDDDASVDFCYSFIKLARAECSANKD